MSKYIFIVSDFELPEVDLTNQKTITVEEAKLRGIRPPSWCTWDELGSNIEITYFEDEDDFNNLCIRRDYDLINELKAYTDKEYIYMISCSSDYKRCEQLLNYILELKLISPIEIYSIWAGDNAKTTPINISIDKLNTDVLFDIIDNFNTGLIINNHT